jgi:phosphate starvation-inducible protein PhoH
LGYLPGGLDDKFNPYLEAFNENLYKCYDKVKLILLKQKNYSIPYTVY